MRKYMNAPYIKQTNIYKITEYGIVYETFHTDPNVTDIAQSVLG